MNGSASGFTTGEETLDFHVITLGILGENLRSPVSGDAAHVVMDSWRDRDWLLGGINTSEDVSGFEDAWESLVDLFGRQVVQVEVDVIGLGANTTTLEDFQGHGAGDNITRGEILGVRSISLHEPLTLRVPEDTAFTTAALSHEATGTVDTSRMELNELWVLNWEASSSDHTTTVASASVSTRARLVGTTISTSSHDGVGSLHSVNGSVSHIVGHDTTALAFFHDKVHREVLNEEDAIVTKGTSEECVQHGVSGTISDSAASVSLSTLAEICGLTTEGSLVDLTVTCSAEGHTIGLELTDSDRSLPSHILDGILISEPVGALDCVIEVESPVILVHVAESGVDSTLSGDSVRSGGEQLGNTSSLESSLGETESSL